VNIAGKSNRPEGVSVTFVLKWTIAALAIFVGIGSGIYTGISLSQTGYAAQLGSNASYLEVGDQMPDYTLYDADGTAITLAELCNQGSVLLAFVSTGCGACDALTRYWQRKVFTQLDSRIQLIWLYDSLEALPEENHLAMYGVRNMRTNRRDHMQDDGIAATPTLVGLGPNRTIEFISTGFDRRIGAKQINDLL
jgi:hypothetical protein